MSVTFSEPICITPGAGHFTFGYYDRNPWDASMRYHLVVNIPQQERLPKPDEKATVGVVDMKDNYRFLPLGETVAWNHQMGSMTMWLKHEPGCFVYNDAVRQGNGWHFIARVHDVEKGEVRTLPRPVYCLSPKGNVAATLDFGRITFRRGYSYMGADSSDEPGVPDDAGVWMMDLKSGEAELICSIKRMASIHPHPYELTEAFVWLNHLGFNADGSRLMALFRYAFPDGKGWKTFLYTMNPDGSDLCCALPNHYWSGVSHQLWGRTPREILLDANWRRLGSEFIVFNDGELVFDILAEGSTGRPGHLSFSPDGKWILADTYPHPETRMQRLRIVNVETAEEIVLGEFYHDAKWRGDLRCDLHPRWRGDGKAVSCDSVMSGERKVYVIALDGT